MPVSALLMNVESPIMPNDFKKWNYSTILQLFCWNFGYRKAPLVGEPCARTRQTLLHTYVPVQNPRTCSGRFLTAGIFVTEVWIYPHEHRSISKYGRGAHDCRHPE
jgi:hypothetical protein